VPLPGCRSTPGCRLRFGENPTHCVDIKTHMCVWFHEKSFHCYLIKFYMVYNHMNLHDVHLMINHLNYIKTVWQTTDQQPHF
jgi:hypothetical protein